MYLGIDVGGTNTDAVLIHGTKVIDYVKTFTTKDITTGISNSISELFAKVTNYKPADIKAVMLGTTHFINSILERKNLSMVAAIRLCLPASTGLPPMVDWPDDLKHVIGSEYYFAHGGYEFNGEPISNLKKDEIIRITEKIANKGIKHIALSCIFSPINNEMELEAASIMQNCYPEACITLSSEIGCLNLLERESSTILNASLREMAPVVISSIENSLRKHSINSPLFLTQNDGTLIKKEIAEKYPIMTISSGPTNSMRGAAFLSGHKNAIVVDIGGTTSDCGMIIDGFPKEALNKIKITGIRSNFRMPDTVSIALGGGSRISFNPVKIGPESIGYNLINESLVFGGNTVTATDIAVAAGLAEVGDIEKTKKLCRNDINNALNAITEKLENLIDKIKIVPGDLPLILVGGGAILAGKKIKGASAIITPNFFSVANAIGATLAFTSGEVDKIYYVENMNNKKHKKIISSAIEHAKIKALNVGADKDSLKVLSVEEIPIAYLPGGATRIKAKVIGRLKL